PSTSYDGQESRSHCAILCVADQRSCVWEPLQSRGGQTRPDTNRVSFRSAPGIEQRRRPDRSWNDRRNGDATRTVCSFMAFEKQDGPHWKKGQGGNIREFNHRLNETRQSSPILERGDREHKEIPSQ